MPCVGTTKQPITSIEDQANVSRSEPVLSVVYSSAAAGGFGASNCSCRDRVPRLAILAGAAGGDACAGAQSPGARDAGSAENGYRRRGSAEARVFADPRPLISQG